MSQDLRTFTSAERIVKREHSGTHFLNNRTMLGAGVIKRKKFLSVAYYINNKHCRRQGEWQISTESVKRDLISSFITSLSTISRQCYVFIFSALFLHSNHKPSRQHEHEQSLTFLYRQVP